MKLRKYERNYNQITRYISQKRNCNLPEEKFWSDFAVLLDVFPGLADEAALVGTQRTGALVIGGDSGDGGGHSSGDGTGLLIIIF